MLFMTTRFPFLSRIEFLPSQNLLTIYSDFLFFVTLGRACLPLITYDRLRWNLRSMSFQANSVLLWVGDRKSYTSVIDDWCYFCKMFLFKSIMLWGHFLPVSSDISNYSWELSLNIVLKVLCFQFSGFLIQALPLSFPMIAIVWRQFEMIALGEESPSWILPLPPSA